MTKKTKKEKSVNWALFPGILTGCAALITAIGGCIGVILAWPRPNIVFPATPMVDSTPTSGPQITQTMPTEAVPTPVLFTPTPPSKGQILYGPVDGTMQHKKDGYVETSSANLNTEDFIAQVSFQNPYNMSEGIWDYGFYFENGRDGYYLWIDARSNWFVDIVTNFETVRNIANGKIENLNVSAGELNDLRLTVINNTATLFTNGDFVCRVDLPKDLGKVNVFVGIEFASYNEMGNRSTNFYDFAGWEVQ